MRTLLQRISQVLALNGTLLVIGTLGYMLIERQPFLDAFYMTVISVGSVGYGEVFPLSVAGRYFTIVLILFGVGTVAATFALLAESLFSAEVNESFRKRRMQRQLKSLNDHIIVCGYGRVGRNAVGVLTHENRRPIAVIENSPGNFERIRNDGLMLIEGDATRDDILRLAGIDRAWGLIVATGNDSVNLFVVLSARALNPNLVIVARTTHTDNEAKMIRAGANRVVSPYNIGGQRLAHSLMRPHLTEFLDVMSVGGKVEMYLEELRVTEGSPLINRTIGELDMRRKTGVTLLAVVRHDPMAIVVPDADTRLALQDDLIIIGTRSQLDKLEEMVDER